MTAQRTGTGESPLLTTTLSLVGLQLVSRLFSFALNQLLLRSTSPQALGVATMGLEVVRDTGLFLVREGLRGAVVRSRSAASASAAAPPAAAKSLVSQTLLIPTLLAPVLPVLFLAYSCLPPTPLPDHFRATTALYALSAVVELVAERWYLETIINWETLTSTRVRIEGAAVGVKAVGTLATILVGGDQYALLAFGVGQVVYASTLLAGLGWALGRTSDTWSVAPLDVVEGERKTKARFDPELKKMSWELTKQSMVKQLLTEGDKIVVGRLSKVEDQGGYAVALNYGSLVARILFQPLEESSRLFFSRSLATPTIATLHSTSAFLSSLLLLHTHLSLIFICLCPSFTTPLLYHLLGPRWSASSAPTILRAYCLYLPFLAINGSTEAFFQSVADPVWLRRGSWWMGACSIGFVLAVAAGVRAGMDESGLIWANCVNMAMRIAFSSVFISQYYPDTMRNAGGDRGDVDQVAGTMGIARWMPKPLTGVAFALARSIVRGSEMKGEWKSWRGMGEHLATGAACGLFCLGVIAYSERKSIRRMLDVARRKQD